MMLSLARITRSLGILLTLLMVVPGVALAAPSAQGGLIDPKVVFLEETDMPRGFERTPSADKFEVKPNSTFALRQHSNGSGLIQQIVYSAANESIADDLGGSFVNFLMESYAVEFGEILTLGDKAVSGVGEDENGISVNAVVFKRGAIAGAIVWIDSEGDDLEADTVALAGKMDTRVRAALSR